MMNKVYKLPFYILGYKLYRMFGWPKIFPISLTLSVTNRCNSRCKTCNLWKFPASEKELTAIEWEKVFKSLCKSVMWVTFSGGNQFLRKDFYEIVNKAVSITQPCFVNIPLSNLDVDKTLEQITKILTHSNTSMIVNVSLDGTKDTHNLLRGRKNSFHATIETFHKLKRLKKAFPQLSVCFNTVISDHNINTLDRLHKLVLDLQPDYWTLEPFQNRAEFKNVDEKILLDYKEVFSKIKSFQQDKKLHKWLKLKDSIRSVYYFFSEKTLANDKEIIPCYAGIASISISPSGNVWQCGTKCDTFGSLREASYDTSKVFFSKKADEIRKDIKNTGCYCIQCNAFYTNILCNPQYFIKHFFAKLPS